MDRRGWFPALTFAVLPCTSPSRIAERSQPLAAYLEAGLTIPFNHGIDRVHERITASIWYC